PVDIQFDYEDESDPGPYPVPPDAPIEGGSESDGDRHILVWDRDNCVLYEIYYAWPQPDGSWLAGSGAVFPLNGNELRPDGWTSADAAGLPIFPGLVRYDEAASGEIRHALRFTAPHTRDAHVWPARHDASALSGSQYPPMGQRFRLKKSFDTSSFSPIPRTILEAMKTYGIVLADNGSAWYISGAPDERWDNEILAELRRVEGADFEAVDCSSLIVDADSGACRGARKSAAKLDFNGDSTAEFGLFRPETGLWIVRGATRFYLGTENDRPVPGDFRRDDRQEPAVFRGTNGLWAVRGWSRFYFGEADDLPLPGVYDSSGRFRAAVFSPESGAWKIRGISRFHFGRSGDIPLPADYRGEGEVCPAVFRPGDGLWLVRGLSRFYFGHEGDVAFVFDQDGDGTADPALFRPQTGCWVLRGRTRFYFGSTGDAPAAADYDGDGSGDPAVFRGGTASWFWRGTTRFWFGNPSDTPLGGV
nr:hypothetical protein [bacterium]